MYMPPQANPQNEFQAVDTMTQQANQTSRQIKAVVVVVILLLVALVVYEALSALSITKSTGVLVVNTSNPSAIIEISQANTEAQYVGKDSVKLRLKPGSYLVSASNSGEQTSTAVQINKGQTNNQTLDINAVVAEAVTTNAVIGKLPVLGPGLEYTISYYLEYSNGQSKPVITISSGTAQAKSDALSWLAYQNVTPANYDIQYIATAPPAANGNDFEGH